MLEARPPVFRFVSAIPSPAVLAACRARGIVSLGAATTVAEARALDEAGVDVIVATGFEAGGHRSSFLASAEASLMGTFAFVPLVADRVRGPGHRGRRRRRWSRRARKRRDLSMIRSFEEPQASSPTWAIGACLSAPVRRQARTH